MPHITSGPQIKTRRHHPDPREWPTPETQIRVRTWAAGTPIWCWGERKRVSDLKVSLIVYYILKLSIVLPYGPAITLLGFYPNELKTNILTQTCTSMLIAASVIIAKLGSKLRALRWVTA